MRVPTNNKRNAKDVFTNGEEHRLSLFLHTQPWKNGKQFLHLQNKPPEMKKDYGRQLFGKPI